MKKKRLISVLVLISIILIIGMVVFVYCNEYIDLSKENDAKIVFALEYEHLELNYVLFVAVDNQGTRYRTKMEKDDYQGVIKTCEQVLSEKPNQNSEIVTVEEIEHAYQLLLGLNKHARERHPEIGYPFFRMRWYGIRYKRFGSPEMAMIVDCADGPNDEVLSGESANEIIDWINYKWAPHWEVIDTNSPAYN